MTLPAQITTREYEKFEEIGGLVHVRTTGNSTVTFRGLGIGGRVTEVTVNSATWTALPATALTDRNSIAIQNQSGVEIKINYDSGVSGYVGMIISDGSERTYDISDSIVLYAKSILGTAVVYVEEIA